jgi:hypothetical protein
LRELIEEHIDHDESGMFPKAKQVLDESDAEQMGDRFDDIKDSIIQKNQLN